MGFELVWHGAELKAEVKKIARTNVRLSAKRVTRDAKRRVPIDTGGLRASIKPLMYSLKGAEIAYIEAGKPKEEYIARFVELGTPGEIMRVRQKTKYRTQRMVKGRLTWVTRRRKNKKRTPIKANPYLRPSLNKEKARFLNSFRNAL